MDEPINPVFSKLPTDLKKKILDMRPALSVCDTEDMYNSREEENVKQWIINYFNNLKWDADLAKKWANTQVLTEYMFHRLPHAIYELGQEIDDNRAVARMIVGMLRLMYESDPFPVDGHVYHRFARALGDDLQNTNVNITDDDLADLYEQLSPHFIEFPDFVHTQNTLLINRFIDFQEDGTIADWQTLWGLFNHPGLLLGDRITPSDVIRRMLTPPSDWQINPEDQSHKPIDVKREICEFANTLNSDQRILLVDVGENQYERQQLLPVLMNQIVSPNGKVTYLLPRILTDLEPGVIP